ncbi:MAG: class I SAM-dependent methyltransferase [Akkermansiaceae bacterium]
MENLFNTAISKRKHLLNTETNALRLFDGFGDGLKDTFLETFADKWIISTRENRLPRDLEMFLKSSSKTVYWKRLDQHQKDDPSHLCGPTQDKPFIAKESGVNYQISFQSGYSQGIFLDQRDNRVRVRQATKPGDTILNTFAYTGAFSVCAALAGATTTTLDLSQPYLDWAKQNMQANNLDPAQHYFCKGDTFHWLKRFAKQGRKFNGIILDPPTFSRDDKGKVFTVEAHYDQLIALAAACISPGGWILASTNCRKLTPEGFNVLVKRGLASYKSINALDMPEEYLGESYLKSLWISL